MNPTTAQRYDLPEGHFDARPELTPNIRYLVPGPRQAEPRITSDDLYERARALRIAQLDVLANRARAERDATIHALEQARADELAEISGPTETEIAIAMANLATARRKAADRVELCEYSAHAGRGAAIAATEQRLEQIARLRRSQAYTAAGAL